MKVIDICRSAVLMAVLFVSGCAVKTHSVNPQTPQGADLPGYCRDLIQAVAQRDDEKAWILAKSSNPNASPEVLSRNKELMSAAGALVDVVTQKTPAYRIEEIPAPTGNDFVTVIEAWHGDKGRPFYMGCLMDKKYDGIRGVLFNLNTDLNRVREALISTMRSRAAGRATDI